MRTIVPTLRYRNVAEAIDWLCGAFGFERHLVVPDENGGVRYAELTFGDGMVMLGPVEDTAFGRLMRQPDDAGGAETQICYLFIEDAVAHCVRAKAAGADIVLDIESEGGGHGYSCRDLEGHIWNFGTYDPRKRQREPVAAEGAADGRSGMPKARRRRVALVWGLLLVVAASAVAFDLATGVNGWTPQLLERLAAAGEPGDAAAAAAREQLQHARAERSVAERTVKYVREQLAQERGAREAAERGSRTAREQAVHERQAKEAAERATRDVQASLALERSAREGAEHAAREIRERIVRAGLDPSAEDMSEQLSRERNALEAALRSTAALRSEVEAERSARVAAERASREAGEQFEKDLAAERAVRHRVTKKPGPRSQLYAEPKDNTLYWSPFVKR